MTSSSSTGAAAGSRRAITWVIFIVRPNDVSTTSAPCSWASRATWNAIEESVSTPVTSSFLPSSSMRRPLRAVVVPVRVADRLWSIPSAGATIGP